MKVENISFLFSYSHSFFILETTTTRRVNGNFSSRRLVKELEQSKCQKTKKLITYWKKSFFEFKKTNLSFASRES